MIEPVCITEVESMAPHESKLRRWAGSVAICVGGVALGAGIGTAVGLERPTHTTLAGNNATAELQVGGNDVDLGIIGAHIPSKTSVAGMQVGTSVKLDASQPYSPNKTPDDKILPELLQTFSDVSHEAEKIKSDIIWHVARDSRNGALGGLVTAGALMFIIGAGKRAWGNMEESSREDFNNNFGSLWSKAKYTVGGASASIAIVACGVTGASYASALDASPNIKANPAFDGTALEGSEIVGLAAPLVDSAVPLVQKYITENDYFYGQVNRNFNFAFEKYVKFNSLPSGANIAPILLASDRHCNVGMDRVLSSAAKKFKAQIIATSGDDNFWGSFSFEAACTSGLAERAKSLNIKFVSTIGNHDPHDKSNPTYKQGIEIVDGLPERVDTDKGKITFLSIQDSRRSEFGHDIVPNSPEAQLNSVDRQGKKLGELACESPDSVLLISHDSRAATIAIENGCGKIDFAFSGHTHHRKLPKLINNVYQYTEGSTGGAAPEQPSYGPLETNATFSMLYFNTQTKTPESMIYFTVRPNKSVEFSNLYLLDHSTSNYNSAAQAQVPVINNG